MQNIVILASNVGAAPETRSTQGGTKITSFGLATSRPKRDSDGKFFTEDAGRRIEDTEWHRIACFNGTAKTVIQYVDKGQKVMVRGRIHYTRWTDQENIERYGVEIIADEVTFLSRARQQGTQDHNDRDEDDLPYEADRQRGQEARARPRLRNAERLWRKPVRGRRGEHPVLARPPPSSASVVCLHPTSSTPLSQRPRSRCSNSRSCRRPSPCRSARRTAIGCAIFSEQPMRSAIRPVASPTAMEHSMPNFNHPVAIAFSVVSEHEAGEEFTPALLRGAPLARIIDVDHSTGGVEWLEAVGLPYDSFDVDPVEVAATTARPGG